ncbi:DsbA family oxidoreductase [Hoyosella subflava]|uniref:DSBA-like thioredoxin domain-containing protein n=1 Tax=Hoyosella subflava (strain DSM 45089 / JCM 17490 / NBRC 109087 / DQS3-9A1) TaxID=443218 RepID=F6EN49_HOYSD|nr:DsbA family oxidoreductase [Hoyosella subflava]AEF39366.1 hypothetical protein AS9A_0914 [Hoyosella subflava DQS3-9A1]
MPAPGPRTAADIMRVEFVFDFPCVWSYFTFHRLQHSLARYRAAGGTAELIFRPFQLAPEASGTGEPKRDVLRRSFGDDTDDAIAGIESLAEADGLQFRHTNAVWSNTFDAHRLTHLAQAQGHGERIVERLFRAHHTDELNIADPAVLRRLAEATGVRWQIVRDATVRAELRSVQREGLRSIPALRFDGGEWVIGAQSEMALHAALTGITGSAA